MTLVFSPERLVCETLANVGFGPNQQPKLVGEAK